MFKYEYISNNRFIGIVSKTLFPSIAKSQQNKENIAIISIIDPDSESINIKELGDFGDVISVKFWDLERDFNNYKIISDEIAKSLRDFIIKNKDKKFLIHCTAGVSRSSGVGRAVECLVDFNGDYYNYMTSTIDNSITSYKRYSPNNVVMRKILGIKE